MLSTKYSCEGSPERFSSGSTAKDRIRFSVLLLNSRSRSPPKFSPKSSASTSAASTPPANNLSRFGTRVAQDIAQPVDRCVEAFIEIHKLIAGPNRLAQLLPRHDFARVFQEQRQNSKWLLLKPDLQPRPAQLAGAKIYLEQPKADDRTRSARDFHRRRPEVSVV